MPHRTMLLEINKNLSCPLRTNRSGSNVPSRTCIKTSLSEGTIHGTSKSSWTV